MSELKVEILNKEELKDFFKMYGMAAAVCYNTPEKFAVGVGKSCLKTKHMSPSRSRYITFRFEGISRACADQMARTAIGVSISMQSGRYVKLGEDFSYHTPAPILKNEKAKKIYDEHMKLVSKNYQAICEALEEDGLKGEQVYECARGISPLNFHTKLVMSFTVEALQNFMNKRLCVCAQEEIRKVALAMKKEVIKYIPELESELVSVCVSKMYCPESPKRSCQAYPQKEELQNALKLLKKDGII